MRKRLGNFIMAEDDQTLEGVVLATPAAQRRPSLAMVETFTGGQIAARLRAAAGRRARVPPRHRRARSGRARHAHGVSTRSAESVAASCASDSGASHALAVLIELDDGADRPDFGGTICVGIADTKATVVAPGRA